MTRTLRYLLLFVFTGLSGSVFAQEIAGKVLDEKKEPLINATVQVYQGGILKGGNITDYDGFYLVKPLDPGYYDVFVSYAGYDSMEIRKVVVPPGGRVTQNFDMVRHTTEIKGVVIREFKKKLVDQDNPGKHVMTADEIKVVPTNELTDVAALSPSLYQKQRGQGLNIGGARATGTLYIIDGVQVQNIGDAANTGINMSQGSVEQLEVITSGIPAKYGDVSGGVVSVTSRGVSQKMTGDFRLQHSIDGYNNNLASFSIAGPLYKKKIDSVNRKPVLGFALSGDYYNDHNRYPSYYEQYTVKPDVQKALDANPLKIISDNSGGRIYNYASNYITPSDLEQVKQLPHDGIREGRLNGKLDYQVADNLRVTAGGMYDNVVTDQYFQPHSELGSLMASENVWSKNDVTSRGYIRFTQKFGKANDTSSRHNIISNAFYTVQADYQRTGTYQEDPNFKHDLFKYQYVGKFDETRAPQYATAGSTQGQDSLTGRKATVLTGTTSTGVAFHPDANNYNPILQNYTKEYYNSLEGVNPLSINQIQASNGMANGDLPQATYSFNGVGLFASPGYGINGYSNFVSDQYALDVNASFDLLAGKTKHAIEFGLYYQQRIIKSYAADMSLGGTNSLWALMRGLVSSPDNGNLRLDKLNPIFIVNGQRYTYNKTNNSFLDANGNVAHIIPGPNDTVVYNYRNIGTSTFDKNLRKELGVTDNAVVNIDNIDPAKLSLGMFSPDELLNVSGNAFINYYGYTYDGKSQGTVNFNDFFTQKDANGNFTRPIGAFTPNYIAGYIQDRFDYKDIHFNVGVRIDRYSANTKVLKDPYSLYPEQTVADVSGANNVTNLGVHPSNMGSNYVVYVNDNTSSNPTIIGYRNGTTWYDPHGNEIDDPAALKQYSDGRDPQPYIQPGAKKLSDTSFNPNLSFTDYSPQVTVMPRVQFSFPISDVANFYAHYDIYEQRPYPNTIGNQTPYDYFKLEAAPPTGVLNNANLRSQKTFDYEVGFQQKLTDHSAITMSAFYKERKDMINIVPVLYAWPFGYQTFGNRDFSSTKGTSLTYDYRATNNLKMSISYTLQFAEGTGSTYNGGKGLLGNLIDAGVPNLRYVTALDYDSRHSIAANIDYRYGDGEGPVIDGLNVLQNAGANFVIKTRSGEPYTRYTDALGQTVIGGVNGSRLPWHFGTDLRLDKDFALHFGQKRKDAIPGVKARRMNYIKAIIIVNNLLNTREVLGVYGFTGRPDDNGYLTSSYGKQFVPAQISPLSYQTLYTIYMNDPSHFNYARTINFALEFNF